MKRSGFTLIEALIAIALVAAVLPVALAGVSRAGQAVGQSHRQQTALRLAQNKLNWLVASGDWAGGSTSGSFDPALDGEDAAPFRWQVEVTPWRDPAVRQLHVVVSWEPAAASHQVALDTWVTTPDSAADAQEEPL